eukprot:s327_g16.t2
MSVLRSKICSPRTFRWFAVDFPCQACQVFPSRRMVDALIFGGVALSFSEPKVPARNADWHPTVREFDYVVRLGWQSVFWLVMGPYDYCGYIYMPRYHKGAVWVGPGLRR